MAFSEKLWTVTHPGTPVIIAGSYSDPWELTHSGLVLGADAETEFADAVAALDGKRHPADWDGAAESVIARLQADADFQGALRKRMHPGMVMVVTDTPLHPDRRSGKDFVIMGSA